MCFQTNKRHCTTWHTARKWRLSLGLCIPCHEESRWPRQCVPYRGSCPVTHHRPGPRVAAETCPDLTEPLRHCLNSLGASDGIFLFAHLLVFEGDGGLLVSATSFGTQGLLPALHPRSLLAEPREPSGMPGIEPGKAVCKARALPLCCRSGPVHLLPRGRLKDTGQGR